MASTLTAPKSHNLPHFIGKNYEIALGKSIEALLNSDSRSSTNFISEFQQLVQSKADPPLESIWVYAALSFTSAISTENDPFGRISAIKDLFQLIASCSASCNPIKSIALAAPVIYHLHSFVVDFKGFQLRPKKERKLNGEIKSVVDSVLGFVNVCCNGFDGNFDELGGLLRPLSDLTRFWAKDNGVRNKDVESLRLFFPLLSDEIVNRISAEGCLMIDLAGFVVSEAFLLKLCWKIREEGYGEKMKNELRSWIVGSITGLGSSYFYVTLVSMILEPVLPVTSLMNPEHENDLRKVLFDALILAEYSFLSPASLGQLPIKQAKRVLITKLMATHEAIELFMKCGDHKKAMSYSNAFANSSLPALIIKWVRSDTTYLLNTSEPTGSSPAAYLRWMLNMENRGIKIFDDDMVKFRTAFISKEQLADVEKEGKKPDPDLLFYIDNKGQEEDENMSESMNAAFTAAAHSMHSSERGGRKTKEGKKRNQVKYNAFDHSLLSGEWSSNARNVHSDSKSDLENPSSDDDMDIRG